MALAWLVSPQKQFMSRSGTINAAGYLRVFDAATDDTVVTYSNFSGGENPELVQFDSDGRANVIADDSRAYRIEVYDRYGSLLWTASPVWCMTTGGGVTATQVISSDRSVAITRTAVGGTVQYDLSTRVGDSTDLLEWISCSGDSEYHDGTYHLEYNAGTMETGERGIRLYAKRYYHVTAEVTVSKDGVNPVYDNIDFVLYFRDGEGNLEQVAKFARVGDYSMGLAQCWTVACDCMPDTDAELVLRVEGKDLEEAGGFTVTRFDVHRVFSGAPALPGGAVSKDMLDDGLAGKQDVIDDLSEIRAGAEAGATAVQPGDLSSYATKSEVTSGLAAKQDTLIAGANITIEDNVISATGGGGGGGGTTYTAGEGINIQDDEISVDTDVIQEKLTAGSNITISGNTISASAAPQVNADWDANSGVAQILNRPNLATVATTGSYDDLSDKPSIPTFTSEQQASIDSGINSTKVGAYDTHVADTTIHVTSTDKTNWNAKEDASNKKQSIDDSSTTDFPSSKAVADFVNSSVATATARFLGSFTLTDLGLSYGATNAQIATALDNHTWPSGTSPTNNDYVYVEIQDPQTTSIDDEVRRFKFNGTAWAYEYTLNNSSFTAAEKAAIDSGITSTLVTAYSTHVADSTIHVTSSDKSTWNAKQDAISDLSTIRSGASSGATAVQPGDLATVATTGSYSDLTGKPTIPVVDQTYNASSTNAQSGTAVAGALAGINQVPASTFYDEDKVLTVNRAGNPVWAPAQGGTQVQSDWAESDSTDPSYIQNKPTEKVLTAGSNVTITDGVSEVTISATDTTYTAGSGLTLNNGEFSVNVGSGLAVTNNGLSVAADQSYNASSTNAQSGTAVAGALATVNQVPASTASDEDKVLTVNSSGTPVWRTPSGGGGGSGVQANWTESDSTDPSYIQNKPTEKPIVPGNGIAMSEDANSISISANPATLSSAQLLTIAQALGVDETVLWEGTITTSGHSNVNVTFQLSESILNFKRIEVYCTSTSNSAINYMTWHPVSGATGHIVASQTVNESENNEVYIGGVIIVEANSDYKTLRYRCGFGSSYGIAYRGDYWGYGVPYKVVGIRRIAGGN